MVAIYPTVGGPTLAVDAVQASQSLASNGNFRGATAPWLAQNAANLVVVNGSPYGTTPYDGTSYVGWQRQLNGVSIQQRLEEAFTPLLGRTPTVVGAGSTSRWLR